MYKITIIETKIEEKPAGKEWEMVGECEDSTKPRYDYTPEIMKKQQVETKIYEQSTEVLDLKAVIRAVNG